MRGIVVGPLDRLGIAVVMTDVALDFACEVRDGDKDSAGNDIALDLGEPEFDLVEPGRIGRGKVKADV